MIRIWAPLHKFYEYHGAKNYTTLHLIPEHFWDFKQRRIPEYLRSHLHRGGSWKQHCIWIILKFPTVTNTKTQAMRIREGSSDISATGIVVMKLRVVNNNFFLLYHQSYYRL